MTKLLCWLFIKSITPEIKIVFSNNGSSFEYATNTVYLDFNDDCTGFMRHLKFEHGMRGADNFNIIMWQMLHEVGHFYTLDYCEDDESLERTICALIDEDEAKNSEKIQNIYFNLEKEWEATEWASNYLIFHEKKCTFFSKLLDILN